MTIKVEFKNFKHLRDFKAQLESGNIYFVKGGNDIGKTSFLQGLLATIKGKNANKQAVSFGETEGSIKTQILNFKGADGENYTIKFDFADGKDDKFVIVRPDTTVSKKSTDISSIFKYNSFTVDEFFAWGLTAEGRRKQAQIILAMLSEDTQKEISDIDSKINTRNGTIFEDRKRANAVYESKKAEYENITLTANEEKILAMPEWIAETEKMKSDKEEAMKVMANSSTFLVNIERLKGELNTLQSNRERSDNEFALLKENTAKEIDRLKNIVLQRQAEIEKEVYAYEQAYEAKTKELNEEKKKVNADNLPDIEKIEADLLERKPYMEIYDSARRKQELKEQAKLSLQDHFEKVQKLTENLEELRKRKLNLIASANLPVQNISIEGDEIFYVTPDGNLLPFNEENISYAKGGLTVAQIMLAVNKDLPLLLVGKAAEYDNNSMAALAKFAEQNNAVVIMDRVLPEATELTIECYEGKQTADNSKTESDVVGLKKEVTTEPLEKQTKPSKPFNLDV